MFYFRQKDAHIRIETTKSKSIGTTEKSKVKNEVKDKKVKNEKLEQNKDELEGKYQHYFSFNTTVRNIRPHQVALLLLRY